MRLLPRCGCRSGGRSCRRGSRGPGPQSLALAQGNIQGAGPSTVGAGEMPAPSSATGHQEAPSAAMANGVRTASERSRRRRFASRARTTVAPAAPAANTARDTGPAIRAAAIQGISPAVAKASFR